LVGFDSADSRQQTADSTFWFIKQQTAAFFLFGLVGLILIQETADSRQQMNSNQQEPAVASRQGERMAANEG
jgi:hypothetical protein